MSVKKTNKYKKCKKEYQYKLYHGEEIKKASMARNYKVSIQCLNNWINRDDWNELSDYIDVPAIIAKNEIEIRTNSKYTPELVEDMFFYSKEVTQSGELKYKTKDALRIKLELSKSTFSKYMNKREFYQSYIEGRKEAEKEIKKIDYERALDRVALGCKVEETKNKVKTNKQGEVVAEEEIIINKEILPNVKALEMGLNKYAPGEYDKKPVEEKKGIVGEIDWENITEEELTRLSQGGLDVKSK